MKKGPRPAICYLEKVEMDALLAAPDVSTPQGRRDFAILLFLYNTGTRADEVAQLRVDQLTLSSGNRLSLVLIHGKGNKDRCCPLWDRTVDALKPLIASRPETERLFVNRRGEPYTRFGINSLAKRNVARAAKGTPSLMKKRVSTHVIRHTTATHLLRSGVDINTIRAWLGHVCLSTTNVYAEVDLEMKAKALAACEIKAAPISQKSWQDQPDLMKFLRSL